MKFSELKHAAKGQIKGNILVIFLSTLALGLIYGAASVIVIGILLIGVIEFGPVVNMNRMYKGEKATMEAAFSGFSHFFETFCLSFAKAFFLILWFYLFFIPGFIKSYSYSCAMYIKQEDTSKGAFDCITESRQLMNGYKMKMFLLDLSFIPWIFVGLITFGIGFIWISPYMFQTRYNFYQQIKGTNTGTPAAVNTQAA